MQKGTLLSYNKSFLRLLFEPGSSILTYLQHISFFTFYIFRVNMRNKPNIKYFKTVLLKVKKYPLLFKKELNKAKNSLSSYDFMVLMMWVKDIELSSIS